MFQYLLITSAVGLFVVVGAAPTPMPLVPITVNVGNTSRGGKTTFVANTQVLYDAHYNAMYSESKFFLTFTAAVSDSAVYTCGFGHPRYAVTVIIPAEPEITTEPSATTASETTFEPATTAVAEPVLELSSAAVAAIVGIGLLLTVSAIVGAVVAWKRRPTPTIKSMIGYTMILSLPQK